MSVKKIQQIQEDAIFRASEIATGVRGAECPLSFQIYLRDYYELYDYRTPDFWRWLWVMLSARDPGLTLSCVSDEKLELAAALKLNLVMAYTIADDVADEIKDEGLMREVLSIELERDRLPPNWNETHEGHNPTVKLIGRLLDDTVTALSRQPSWHKMRDAFFFDFKQVWNAPHHAFLTGQHPELINYEENRTYDASAMMFFVFSDVDIACSDTFDFRELPHLRGVVYHTQIMARISNWVSTWERELVAGDMTSGLVSMLLSRGFVTIDEIWYMSEAATTYEIIEIAKQALVPDRLYEEWEQMRERILEREIDPQTWDLSAYLAGVEMTMCYYLACKGMV